MRLAEFVRRYRWYLVAALLIYLGVSLWLFAASDGSADAPFLYLVF